MSQYLQPLYNALRTPISRAWVDVGTNGIWEAEHVTLVPLSDLNLPYAAIVVNQLTSTDLGGMCNLAYLASVDIYRFQRVNGPAGLLLPMLEALRDDLFTHPLSYGQVWPDPTALAWHDELLINKILASKGMVDVRAGRLSISVLIGDAAG